MKFKIAAIGMAFSLALIGCGGGGGGGGGGAAAPNNSVPPASAAEPFTVSSFPGVARPTAATILAATSADSSLDQIASTNGSSRLPVDAASLAKWSLARFGPTRESAQSVETIPNTPCNSIGSFSGSFNDADNNDDLSGGDSLTISFNNCVFSAGQPATNGSFTLTIISVAYNAAGDITSASMTMRFNNFSSYGNVLNGAATIAITSNSVSTTYTDLSSSRSGASPVILNYTAVISNNLLTINGLITLNNNTYTLSTPTPITFGAAYPISGLLRVTDAAGGRIDITSRTDAGGSFDCDLYLPGDNVLDSRISSSWSSL